MGKLLDEVIHLHCHPGNCSATKRATSKIKYIVLHYTANDGDNDANNARYFRDNVVQASAHYFVDDDSVTQSVEDNEIAWAVGGSKWRDCPQTGGGKLYGKATNSNSISIEMCDTKRDGKLMATEVTLARAAQLTRELMDKYHIDIDHVIRHFDVTGKHCPAYMMDSAAWEAWKKRLVTKPATPDVETVNGLTLYHSIKAMPTWAQDAAVKAVGKIIKPNPDGSINVWEVNLQALVWLDRLNLI